MYMYIYIYIYIYISISLYICVYIYIYIYIHPLYIRLPIGGSSTNQFPCLSSTPNLHTNIVEFLGFDSSTILNSRGGTPRPIGDLPESLSQAMLVGITLVGKLGVTADSEHRTLQGRRFVSKSGYCV